MKEIAIIGAGIGGLTTAHALRQAGFEVKVFEYGKELRASGSGITLQANAMAALDSLGLASGVEELGHRIGEGRITDWRGKSINELDVGAIADRVGHTGVAIHRARLVEYLARGLEDALEFGASVESAENFEGGARVLFKNGRAPEYDAVVGCDGLHSVVRQAIRGEESLRYAGYTTWRGIARMPAEKIVFSELWGRGRRFGLVPISENEVYWFAVNESPVGKGSEISTLEEVRALFEGWSDEVLVALEKTAPEDLIWTDCFDRPPVKKWGEGRITLVGDAIHPMTPNLGQGGGQAVESAVVLGRCLREAVGIEEGFRRYESMRRPRTKHFVDSSWKIGRVAQWKNGFARGIRNLGLGMTPKSMVEKMIRDFYDFEGWYQGCREA